MTLSKSIHLSVQGLQELSKERAVGSGHQTQSQSIVIMGRVADSTEYIQKDR